MATILCRTPRGVVLMLAPEYEVDVTTRMGLWHNLPQYIICPCDLLTPNCVMLPGANHENMYLF